MLWDKFWLRYYLKRRGYSSRQYYNYGGAKTWGTNMSVCNNYLETTFFISYCITENFGISECSFSFRINLFFLWKHQFSQLDDKSGGNSRKLAHSASAVVMESRSRCCIKAQMSGKTGALKVQKLCFILQRVGCGWGASAAAVENPWKSCSCSVVASHVVTGGRKGGKESNGSSVLWFCFCPATWSFWFSTMFLLDWD